LADNNCISVCMYSAGYCWQIITVYRSVCTVPVIVGRYDNNCISVCMYSAGYCWQIVMNLEFSGQIFEKHSNAKFHENPSSGSRVVTYGRTDM
jgi:hypothetical protein